MVKILVIDDERQVRMVLGAILRQAGYDVIDAAFGLSGYSKAQTEQPDLILLDLMMPVMDGFEVLGKLQDEPSTKRIPVIILTAKIDAASERECMRLGAADYIKKPWGPQEIEERIAMVLGYPKLAQPLPTENPETVDGERLPDKATESAPDESPNPTANQDAEAETAAFEFGDEPDWNDPTRFRTKTFRITEDMPDNKSLA